MSQVRLCVSEKLRNWINLNFLPLGDGSDWRSQKLKLVIVVPCFCILFSNNLGRTFFPKRHASIWKKVFIQRYIYFGSLFFFCLGNLIGTRCQIAPSNCRKLLKRNHLKFFPWIRNLIVLQSKKWDYWKNCFYKNSLGSTRENTFKNKCFCFGYSFKLFSSFFTQLETLQLVMHYLIVSRSVKFCSICRLIGRQRKKIAVPLFMLTFSIVKYYGTKIISSIFLELFSWFSISDWTGSHSSNLKCSYWYEKCTFYSPAENFLKLFAQVLQKIIFFENRVP